MHLTLHVDWRGRKRRLILPLWVLAAVVLSYGALAAVIGGWGSKPQAADAKVWQAALSVAGEELLRVRSESAARVETLTDGLSQLQAQASRLQILGDRVVREAGLDASEFDFGEAAMGGPELYAPTGDEAALQQGVSQLAGRLGAQERQLQAVSHLLNGRQAAADAMPAGWPVLAGRISSSFGYRRDPVHGGRRFHAGVDIPGRRGDPVVAVAAGVVTGTGTRSGYGRTVEITHLDGYSTLYGHNRRLLVREGDVVGRGDIIAELGASGRATGPHVHFEVRRDGRAVDPRTYLKRDD